MKKIENVYIKEFSNITNIQANEKIFYNLCKILKKELTTYGIEIISKKENSIKSCNFDSISNSRKFTFNLLTFLYENSVKPDFATEIITDLLNS